MFMSELREVLDSIKVHCTTEYREHYQNLSIGRGELMMKGMNAPKTLWIVNTESAPSFRIERDITGAAVSTSATGKKDTYSEPGTLAVPKNREFARILLQNYQGPHSCKFMNGQIKDFIIKNSAHYINSSGKVLNLNVGIAGNPSWSIYGSLDVAYWELNKVDRAIEENESLEKEVLIRAEELRKQLHEEAARKAEKEKQKLEEEARKAEEEAERLRKEIEEAKVKREEILAEATKASAFIRKQVSLRKNPVLDIHQDSAKFSNLYNGVAEIISGGPGTGKTTTIIQRLKLLIDRDDLEDYMQNHDDCKLTKKQLDIISASSDNWIYFSPNDLLKKYLQDNMNYEGLTNTNRRTVVWKDFLKDAIRDDYHIAGQECPFDFMGKKSESRIIYTGNHIAIIENFTKFFMEQVKDRFRKVAKVDYDKFEWRFLGKVITEECAKVESVNSLETLLRFLIHMNGIDEHLFVNNNRVESGAEINSKFNDKMNDLADYYAVLLKRDEKKYNEVIEFIKSLDTAPQLEVEEGEETEETTPDYGDQSLALHYKLTPLLKKLTLQFKDNTAKLTPQQKQLYEIVKDIIVEDDIKPWADAAYFVKYMNPALRGFTQYALSPIPNYYKQYRKSMPEADRADWDAELLKEMLDTHKNKKLLSQEQSFLVGFINNMAKALYKADKKLFENATHKYILAYKNLCRPVIGVDEATDYSLIEFYGIKSFGHYEVCSYTLCGDIMQLMKTDGISNWKQLKHPLLFEKIDVKDLLISYRQSEELLRLADLIYQEELKKKSPYECYLKGEECPKPLWLELQDMEEKADWISKRVMEIIKTYGYVPTIAIFTIDKHKAEELKECLDECENLIEAGIDVKVCSDNTLEGEKTLRIFPIDQVKGMEFEAVFFYDIDDIESTSLINKYLYVGLSRASMYLAVTSNGRSKKISKMLQKYFETDANWVKKVFRRLQHRGDEDKTWKD
jgi:hypothetical protein